MKNAGRIVRNMACAIALTLATLDATAQITIKASGLAYATISPKLARMKIEIHGMTDDNASNAYKNTYELMRTIKNTLEKGSQNLPNESYINKLEAKNEQGNTPEANATVTVQWRINPAGWQRIVKMVDLASQEETNTKYTVELVIDKEEVVKTADSLVIQAMRNARRRAELAAQAEGLTITHIQNVEIDGNRIRQRDGEAERIQVEARVTFNALIPEGNRKR